MSDNRFSIQSILNQTLALSLYDIENAVNYSDGMAIPNVKIVRAVEYLNDSLQQASQYTKSVVADIEDYTANKWAVLKTEFYQVNQCQYILSGDIKYTLKPLTNIDFQNAVKLENVSALPQVYSYFPTTKEIWVYPIPSDNGYFQIIGKKYLPIIDYSYTKEAGFIFTPSSLKDELQYDAEIKNWVIYNTAKNLTVLYNAPWAETKGVRLNELKVIMKKRNFDISIDGCSSVIPSGHNFERIESGI